MSDGDFFRTPMGHRYYEHTLPEMVRQLARIADALERLSPPRQPSPPAPATDPGSRSPR